MHHRDIRRALQCAALFFALVAGAAFADPQPTMPAGTLMSDGAPYRVKLYRAHYQVKADFTYSEQVEMRQEVLTEMGARMSRNMPIGAAASPMPTQWQARKVDLLEAYTLKKNGKRIPATRVRTMPAAAPMGMPPLPDVPLVAFQDVEAGDTVVLAYKAEQRAADPPGHFVLNRVMTRFWIWDDVEISLTAPAAMKLRARMQGVDAPAHTATGATQQWTWKFSNPAVVTPSPGMPPYANALTVHVTSFPTDEAEHAYLAKTVEAMTPPQVNLVQECLSGFSPSDGPDGLDALAGLLATFYQQNPAEFERTVNALNSPKCVFDDGKPKLTALKFAYSRAFNQTGDWAKSYEHITQLKKDYPGRPFVALAEAEYWIAYAWDARGQGYSSSVAQEGWKLFGERLQKAEKVLLDSRPYAADYALWYDAMTQVESLLDRPERDRAALVIEGLKRYPRYYPLYTTMQNYLLPKWGGSWEAVDGFVNWSVRATKQGEAESLYALLYWNVDQKLNAGEVLFRDTKASWPRMKQGFEDLLARHPRSAWNLNNFAHFACMAGDRNTYRKLRKKIGRNVMDGAWQAQPSLDLCEAKFGV